MSYDCYCESDVHVALYRATLPVARKSYRCEECPGVIQPGERYERVFAIWDGHPSTIFTCERCYDLRVWTKNNVPCLCIQHGGMDDELRLAIEDACFRAPLETVGLYFGFLRRKVLRDRHNRGARAN